MLVPPKKSVSPQWPTHAAIFHRRLSLRSLRSVQRWTKSKESEEVLTCFNFPLVHVYYWYYVAIILYDSQFMTFHDMCNHSHYDWKRSCDSVALAGTESMHPLFWYRQVIHGSCVHRKHVEQNGSRRVMAESFETGKLHWRDTLGDDSIKINQILTRTLLVSTSKIIPLHVTHWFDSTILFIILQSHELWNCMECFFVLLIHSSRMMGTMARR